MPELPEVETVRRGVEAAFGGLRIRAVEVDGIRTLRRHADPAGTVAALAGLRLERTSRRGKYLVLHLDGAVALVVHLGMSGQLRRVPSDSPPERHTHLRVAWEHGPELRFVDPRTFGEVFVSVAGPGETPAELAHLGFDPLVDGVGPAVLGSRLAVHRRGLKPLLMDQRFVAGIGNIYSDEILWAARLRHDRPGRSLSPARIRALHAAMIDVLGRAVELRGSSLADEQYRDLDGDLGGFQAHHRVYGREGGPCARCATPVVRLKAYGRSTYFCPRCQR